MAKSLKIIGILIGAVIALISALLLYIILIFDPNEYKPQISSAVEDATGRQLTIQGDIGLSVFPWLGMELGEITLSNAAGFDDVAFAHIDGADVKLKLLPLLNQEVEMQGITLHGLRLNMQIDENGKTNWDDLSQSDTAPAEQTAPTPPTEAPQPAQVGLAALAIGGVKITDANVVYDDRSSGARYVIEDMNLITGPVSLNDPIDVSLNSLFNSNQPQISGKLDLKTRIIADIDKGEKHRLDNTQITLDFDSPEFASRGQIKLNSDIAIDLPQEQYQLNNLVLETNLENADLPTGKLMAKLIADIQANLTQQTASISKLKFNAYDLEISGKLAASKILDTPEFSGDLAIAEFNARQLMQLLEIEAPETADPDVLKKVSLATSFSGTPEAVKIKPLALTLDDSSLNGWLDVAMIADKSLPVVRYELKMDEIDADRYLPPVSEDETTAVAPAPPATAGAAAASTLPMETLRDMDINGKLDLDKLKFSNLRITEIKTKLDAKDGVIQLQPLAKLYQGSYKGNMILDARQDVPKYKLDEALIGIEAAPLLKDYMDDDMLSGKGDITAKLTTQGNTPDEMTQALNGNLSMAFKNGNLRDFNLAQMVREAKAKLKKEELPAKDELQGTDFTELTGTFKVINGVIHNNDLATKSPFIRINGEGTIDLVKEQLDYLINSAIVKSQTGEGGAALDELKGLKIPVRITGSFTDPKIDLQYDELIKAMAKEELDRAKAELKAKADAEKARLKARMKAEEAEARQRLEAEKAAIKQKLDAEQAAAELKLKQKEQELKEKQKEELRQKEEELKDKLKGLFK